MLIFASFLCLLIYISSEKYNFFESRIFLNCLPTGIVFTLLGGKFLFALVLVCQGEQNFWHAFLFGGFVYYGGMLGGFFGIALACLHSKRNILDHLDVITSLLPLGQAVGRIGCFLNGCCYGIPYKGVLSVEYPINDTIVSVFPTWFVESLFCFLLFIYFQLLFKTRKRGIQTGIYLIAYSSFRFFIEFIRGDKIRGLWREFSTSQFISVFLICWGIWILYYAHITHSDNTFLN